MRLLPCIALLSAMLWMQCSSSPDLAGGSGAGNPGGAATVAIIADTIPAAQTLSKAANDSSRRLLLADDAGSTMTVASARIPVYKIYFILETNVDCEALIDTFDSNLSCDSNSIVLNGPFIFDAITGEVDPLFDTLRLPIAYYRSIKLIIGCDSGADSILCTPIEISGTFEYQDTTRSFMLNIIFNTMLLYKYTGTPALIDPNDSTLFQVTVSAANWLTGTDFSARLSDSTLALDSLGNLAIDGAAISGAGRIIANAIRDNIADSFRSAKLEILKDH